MLPVTGYAESWSVRQGETLRFMISSAGGAPYQARVARILCGDPNPAGPGYRERAMPCAIEGEHPGREQPVAIGSWVDVERLDLPGGAITFSATIWPTLLAAGEQAVLCWQGGAAGLTLGVGPQGAWCRLSLAGAPVQLGTGIPLTERAWLDIACTVDPASGTLVLRQTPHRRRLDCDQTAQAGLALPAGFALSGPGAAAIAASRAADGVTTQHFNGKIEQPRIHDPQGGASIAAWDFARDIPTDRVSETVQGADGICRNLPTRAMTGCRWHAGHQRWTDAPEFWGAIHFHDDDIGDLGWQASLALEVPPDWASGVYALHLEAGGGRDNIVFFVRAADPGRRARVAFLAPTFTYTVYSQFVRPGRQAQIAARAAQWGALANAPDGHLEFGLSPYNHHRDGSGVVMSSLRRPMIDKRVNQFHLMDPDPAGSGTYWIAADTYILDLLDRRGIEVEIITDHDLHAEGLGLLSRYQAVLTGQHPEYHSLETLDAIAGFLEQGGRFAYLGGNGFYWKVVPHGEGPWALELRRAEGGIRLWETLPGESYHAWDGSYGGLWRRLGRPPQQLVGVGFSAQGNYSGFPYRFTEAIADPRVAFLRAGIEAAITPGAAFGERGFMGGGAAGHELDRADPRLGTPLHALVVACGIVEEASYQPVNEERRDHVWPGPREAIIRADVTFFETPNGGAVFSVGSMNFIGALPVDGYHNVAASLIENMVRRFADPAPLSPVAASEQSIKQECSF